MKERIEIREMEDGLIEKGLMKESDRMEFTNNSKMIALSSASYTFENLYKTYKEWMQNIYDDSVVGETTYFISQLGWESLPEHMIDSTVIEEAQNGGQSHSSFQREYCAQFTDGSDSYYSGKKMHECTIPDGEAPHTLIRGLSGQKYLVAIDPSFSNSPSSDYFAMCVLELDVESKHSTVVHNYAVAGGDLKDHIKYFKYLTDNFDLEMICIDNAGFQFIDSCNESQYFSEKPLKFIDINTDKEGVDYTKEIKKAKGLLNKENGSICFKQLFTSNWLRKSNEYLQAAIDHKRMWFASRSTADNKAFDSQSKFRIDMDLVGEEDILGLIETQDNLVYQVKKQCALIEVKSTAKGTQTFDLPQHLKRNTSANRARRDNYTTLLMANWAAKVYYDIQTTEIKNESNTFSPILI